MPEQAKAVIANYVIGCRCTEKERKLRVGWPVNPNLQSFEAPFRSHEGLKGMLANLADFVVDTIKAWRQWGGRVEACESSGAFSS